MDIAAAAERLEEARRTRTGLPPLSRGPSGLSEDDAWAIAAEVDRRRLEHGHRRTGYKLGWTSAAMREALGIDRPNYGSLWDDMEVRGSLPIARLRHPKAEPEIAFRADEMLAGAQVDAADVRGAGRWAVAIEVVDPRWESYDFTWLDNTADSSSAAAYVTGGFVDIDVAPEELTLTMAWGGAERTGQGSGALGSPAEAVGYLVRELATRDAALEPGMVVLTGGLTAPVDLRAGLEITVSSPQLGSCSMTAVA